MSGLDKWRERAEEAQRDDAVVVTSPEKMLALLDVAEAASALWEELSIKDRHDPVLGDLYDRLYHGLARIREVAT